MTAIYPNKLQGIEKSLKEGFDIIEALYAVGSLGWNDDGKSFFVVMAMGTRILRWVQFRLAETVGDEGMDHSTSTVNGMFGRNDVMYEQFEIAKASVLAAVFNPFNLAADDVRQEAAVEQIRSASIILKHTIELIEN